MQTQDHIMVGVTSLMIFICYKMMFAFPFIAGLMLWFNMRMFNRYCMQRKNGLR